MRPMVLAGLGLLILLVLGVLFFRQPGLRSSSSLSHDADTPEAPDVASQPAEASVTTRRPDEPTGEKLTVGLLRVIAVCDSTGNGVPGLPVFVTLAPHQGKTSALSPQSTSREGLAEFHVEASGILTIACGTKRERITFEQGKVATVTIKTGLPFRSVIEVVDEAGQFVPGAQITQRLDVDGISNSLSVGVTKEEGRLETSALLKDALISAEKPEFGRSNSRPLARSAALFARSGEPPLIRLTIRRMAGSIAGRILDANSLPVRDAVARALTPEVVPGMVEDNNFLIPYSDVVTRTDADGFFRLEGLSEQNQVTLHISAAGFTDLWAKVPWGTSPCEFHLDPEITVSGIVRDQTGAAVANCTVTSGDPRNQSLRTVVSDVSGFYLLKPTHVVESHEDRRFVFLDGGRVPPSGSATKTVYLGATCERGSCYAKEPADGKEKMIWNPVLKDEPCITGIVVDAEGVPQGGFHIIAHLSVNDPIVGNLTSLRREAMTAEDGRFELRNLPGERDNYGQYVNIEVYGEPQREYACLLRKQVRGRPQNLRLEIAGVKAGTARIQARVLEKDGKAPEFVRFSLICPAMPPEQPLARRFDVDVDDGSGMVDVLGVLPGRYQLGYRGGRGPRFIELGEFDLVGDQTLDFGTIWFSVGGRAEGRIIDEGGHVLEFEDPFGFRLISIAGSMPASFMIRRGLFQGVSLPAGEYRLETDARSAFTYRLAKKPLSVTEGQTTRVEVVRGNSPVPRCLVRVPKELETVALRYELLREDGLVMITDRLWTAERIDSHLERVLCHEYLSQAKSLRILHGSTILAERTLDELGRQPGTIFEGRMNLLR